MGFGMVGISPFCCEALSELGFPAEENANISIYYEFANIIYIGADYLSTWKDKGKFALLFI